MASDERIGEVIEASTAGFSAQCYELYHSPPLGSLVKTLHAERIVYAVVYNAATTSLEPGRRPLARGKNEATEEAIYLSNPQLLKLLKSEFDALVVGHREENNLHHYLPAHPARIHSFVYLCSDQEVREFSESFDFLELLINSHLPVPSEELVAACLRRMADAHPDRQAFLVAAGKMLAILMSGDFHQLKTILGKIRQ